MKNLIFLAIMVFCCFGCRKDEFNPDNPNVVTFVHQIKNGTYNCYKKAENGEKLWLLMPEFTKDHIQTLITLAEDTSHVGIFPTNPMSSRTPIPAGRDYYILGECLLWTVEGIRNGSGYGSLDTYLVDTTKDIPFEGLNAEEILMVRDLYQDWWTNYKVKNWQNTNPLEGKPYRWF